MDDLIIRLSAMSLPELKFVGEVAGMAVYVDPLMPGNVIDIISDKDRVRILLSESSDAG